MSDRPRLETWRDVLTQALGAYLVALNHRWAAVSDAQADPEVERVVAAVGTVAEPTAAQRRAVAEQLDRSAADGLARVGAACALDRGDEALVAAAWWAEADPQLAVVLGCAHDDSARRHPSAALLALVLGPYGIDVAPVLDDASAPVRHGVLVAGAGAGGRLELTPTARLLLAGRGPQPLEPGLGVPVPRLAPVVASLARALGSPEPGAIVLRGPRGIGRRAVAVAAARQAGLIPVSGERPGGELRLLARAGGGVPVVSSARLAELGWRDEDGPLVAIAEAGEPAAGGYVVDLPGPSFAEREALWAGALDATEVGAADRDGLAGALAARFAFTERDVDEVVARARRDARWAGREPDAGGLWDAARRQPQHALQRLAALITPAFTLDDLVLAPDARQQLRELVAHVDLQHVVLDGWGFRRRLPRGQGVITLFAGPPGTGKTMAAEAVAHALRHDLYRIDLSAVVSKYIGETEKNLAMAFDEAERAGAVLFFDEADALFGKRTEVRDAHDRYANLEVNYLLQRVETFTGLVILATNRQSALDEAFVRRLRFVIRFELPDAAFRAELWRRAFPDGARCEALDWEGLAGAELSGGSIQGAALAAAYLAAADGVPVGAAHVEHALRREYGKLGRAFPGRLTRAEVGA